MRKTIYSLTFGLGASLWAGTALADGVTLRALMEDVPETSIIEKMLPQFEKETGIKVEFEKVGYGDMHDKLVAQLVSGERLQSAQKLTSFGRASSRQRDGLKISSPMPRNPGSTWRPSFPRPWIFWEIAKTSCRWCPCTIIRWV